MKSSDGSVADIVTCGLAKLAGSRMGLDRIHSIDGKFHIDCNSGDEFEISLNQSCV